MSPVVSLHVGGGCWWVWPPSRALKWSCLPLSPVVSLHVGGGCWLVWPHVEQKHSEIKITGFNLNLHKFAYCKLFGVYAGVIFLNCVFPAPQVLSGNWMAKAFHVMNLTAGSCAVFVKCWRSNATCHVFFYGRIWEDHLPVMVVLMFCFFLLFLDISFVGSR